jgi:hypothetical protein
VHVKAVEATVRDISGVLQRSHNASPLQLTKRVCAENGTKAAVYNTYVGTGGPDAVLDVAAGKGGANLGKAVAVGYSGLMGTVTVLDPSGGCLNQVALSGDGAVQVTDAVVTSSAILVTVAHTAGADVWCFTYDLDVVATVTYPNPVGGTIRFDGIGVRPNPVNPEVYAVGYRNDGSAGYDNTLVVRLASDLSTQVYGSSIDFGSRSAGKSIDVDRLGNAYIAGLIHKPTTVVNVTFRLDAIGTTIPWANSVWDGVGETNHPGNGMFGVRLLGGATAASGLYSVGSYESPAFNPGFLSLLLVKRNPATGSLLHFGFWYMSGMDLTGEAVVADRDGNAYTAGGIGSAPDYDGQLIKFDPSNTSIVASDRVGGAGFRDYAYGLDLRTSAPTDDAFVAGSTMTSESAQYPSPSGCDATYNGDTDGYVARFQQPFGP